MLRKIEWHIKAFYRINVQKLKFYKRHMIIPPFPNNEDGKLLIHIGPGEIASPEFINIDARPFPHIHYVTANIADLSIFSNNSIDLIYMSHVLEHIPINDVRSLLWEFKRVLKRAGILRLSVPDFDQIIRIYVDHGRDVKSMHLLLMGEQEYTQNFHCSIYNRDYLKEILFDAGFNEVRDWDPNNCSYHDFKDAANGVFLGKNGEKYLISLNLEAVS
jgi:SAM-dependent methyltransferase